MGTKKINDESALEFTPEEEAFFVAEALTRGEPDPQIKYDTMSDVLIWGDMYLDAFGQRARKAGVKLMGPSGTDRMNTNVRGGGWLYEKFKRWHRAYRRRDIRRIGVAAR